MTMAQQMQSDIDRDIDERTNVIWAWVRDNKHSLDSERGCRMMREAITAAIEASTGRIEPLVDCIYELKHELKAAKSAAKKADDGAEAQSKRMQGQLARLAKQAEQPHSTDGFMLMKVGEEVWVYRDDEKWLRVKG